MLLKDGLRYLSSLLCRGTMGGPVCRGSFSARKSWVCIQVSSLAGSGTSGKWPKLFEPQFPHLWGRNGKHEASYPIVVDAL